MSNWRLAESLKKLRDEINTQWPNRSKASDGSVGDTSHSARVSDHNPNDAGVVCAIDVTHDPLSGCTGDKLSAALIKSRDPRIKYIIWNRRMIASYPRKGKPAWTWLPYTGANAHQHHVHISVNPEKHHYDSKADWNLFMGAVSQKSGAEVADSPAPASPLSPPPISEEAPDTQPAALTQTDVTVKDGNVKVTTSEGAKPEEKIAVEKPPVKNFAKEIRNDITTVTGGEIGIQGVREAAESANFLGLSPRFWVWISIFAVVAGATYLVMKYLKFRSEVQRDLELTKTLVNSNSTDANKVVFASKEELEDFKARGYKIVYR